MFLFFSALCYVLPFYFPSTWPLAWLFPVFLFYAVPISSKTALVFWSIITTAFHLRAICTALIAMASGPIWMKTAAPLLLVVYVSLYPIAWLLSTQFLLKKLNSLSLQLTIWTISLWFYLLVLEHILLWPFGRVEGTLFLNPLLPMAYAPYMLAPLCSLPFEIVLLWFCIITSTIYGALIAKNKTYKLLLIIFIAPWLALAWRTPNSSPPAWLNQVGHLPLSLPESISLQTGQAIICHELDQLGKTHPHLRLVIMPESSWYGVKLTDAAQLEWITNHSIANLLIGSFAQEKNTHYNSLYWYHRGCQMQRCDKRHALPFVERALFSETSSCSQLFFHKSPPVCSSQIARKAIYIPGMEPLIPYICSDLYCNSAPDDGTNHTLLVTSNDSWFMPHFQILMALAARWRAIQWGQAALYIAYHHACYFDRFGKTHPIATTAPSRLIG